MALAAGDIAIVSMNADTNKIFSFVALVDIPASEVIKFTDNGWTSANAFRANEGIIAWTAPAAGITKGTVVTINTTGAVTATAGTVSEANDVNFSTSGDQILAYQGAEASPTFLFAVNNEGAAVWQATAADSNTSALPTGLTNGVNAIALTETDNVAYSGPTSGTAAELLAAITNTANWTLNDTANVSAPASFNIGGTGTTTVSINDVSIIEGNSGTSTLIFTVTRSDNTGAFTVDYATADGTATAGSDYAATSGTVTFAAGGPLTQTISVTVNGDTTFETNESFSVTLANLADTSGTAVISDGSGTGTITNDEVTIARIHDIQGSGATSSLVGQTVTVDAIVVGDFQNGDSDTKRNLNGFYLQEAAANADGNAATSEGIFVFASGLSLDVNEGDRVQLTGTFSEFFGMTQITATSAAIISSGNAAPTAAQITLPAAGVTLSQDGDYQPDLEAYEGMLVEFTDKLTITEQFQLDRFNEIKLVAGDRPYQYTHDNAPDAAGYLAHLQETGARTITYDDGLNTQNAAIGNLDGFGPTYNTANAPRMGDTVTGLAGVLDYQWAGNSGSGATWRVRSVEDGTNTFADSATPREASPADTGGELKVGSLNVLNFFTTLDNGAQTAIGQDPRGANNATEFTRQADKLINVLLEMDADVLGLVELENDFLAGSPGNAIEYIVDRLNTELGSEVYDWVDPGQQFVGGDAISVGAIYKKTTVEIAPGTTVALLDDTDLPALGLSGLLSESTIGAIFNGANTSRTAMAITFRELATGETFTVSPNHFKSKGDSGNVATGTDDDQLNGAGNWNTQRTLAAEALSAWLATNPTGTTDADVLITGDLNSYFKEDPITYLLSQGYENLQADLLADPYSYVFDGQLGALDYILANGDISEQVTGIAEWHINSDEADALDYNTDFSRDQAIFDANALVRVSDHDPLIVGLTLNDRAQTLVGDAGTNTLKGGKGNDVLNGGAGNDVLDGGADVDTANYGNSRVAVTANLATGVATIGTKTDTLIGIEILKGGNQADNFTGNDAANELFGIAGNDLLSGLGGIDRLYGGFGNDTLYGGTGNDVLSSAQGNDAAYGEDGDDFLTGSDGNDLLDGGAGNDNMLGEANDDILLGGAGNDRLDGGAGSDTLNGGALTDRLYGGAGNDTFEFGDAWGSDRIFDFENNVDTIDLSNVSGLNLFSQLTLRQVGANVRIEFAGNVITIENVVTADLQDDVIV